jgi:hypothetical protein
MESRSYIYTQGTRRVPSSTAKSLFRTRRSDREDRRSRQNPYSRRSHWCRRDWEDVHRSNYPPRRSHRATVWRELTVYSLRPVPTFKSRAHFLNRLSKAVGAGVENPEDFTPLRSFLSSKEMLIVLDNVESVLDPWGPGTREIYAVVEELSQFNSKQSVSTSHPTSLPFLPTARLSTSRHCHRAHP